MKILEFCRVTWTQSLNNKYLKNRRNCYHSWYYANGSYWQDDSGQVTQRSWLDLFNELTPPTERTTVFAHMFIADHLEAFNDHETTLINDNYPPDYQGDSQRRNQWESDEMELLKSIEKKVADNMKKYEELSEVLHGE